MEHIVMVGAVRFALRKVRNLAPNSSYFIGHGEYQEGDEKIGENLYILDTKDPELLGNTMEALNLSQQISGIVCFTEFEHLAIHEATTRLGLRNTSKGAINLTRDKLAMREHLLSQDLSLVQFRFGNSYEDIDEFIKTFGFPAIVKPTNESGSKNVYSLLSASDMSSVEKWSNESNGFLIEEYLDGPEVSVETYSVDGIHHVLTITDKITTGHPAHVELGHFLPSQLPEKDQDSIKDLVVKFLSSIDHSFGPAHTEMKITSSGPRIIESHVRPGGDCIVDLMEFAFGFDLFLVHARAAAGDWDPKYILPNENGKGFASIRFIQSPPGIVKSTSGFDEIENMPGWVRTFNPYVPGKELKDLSDSSTRAGWIMAAGQDPKQLARDLDSMLSKVTIELEDVSE